MRSMILGGLPDRCQRHAAAAFLVVFAALLAVSTAAQAQVLKIVHETHVAGDNLVDNLTQLPADNGIGVAGQQFTTGTNVGGYTIRNVRIRLGTLDRTDITVRIKENFHLPGLADSPVNVVAELEGPQLPLANRGNTFDAPAGTTLDANTKYWISVNEDREPGSRADYGVTDSGTEMSEPGWSIANSYVSKYGLRDFFTHHAGSSIVFSIRGFPNAGLCDRTPQVRDALLALISGIRRCYEVTDAHLAAISGTLSLVHEEITALKARDFAGLSSLEILELGNNMLTELPDGVFDELTALEVLKLSDNALDRLSGDVFDELTALKSLWLDGNALGTLRDDVFDELTALESLYLDDNVLGTLRDDVFDELSSLEVLHLGDNLLAELPDGVFAGLTALESLYLAGNPEAPYAPTAVVAKPDGARVGNGGTRVLRGDLGLSDGGPWGTNVTYHWALASPARGVDVSFDDNTSRTPMVTILTLLAADTDLTFTLTMTGRGGPSGSGIASVTDTVTVTVRVDVTAGICGRTPEVRDTLVNQIQGVSYCAYVTGADLTTLTGSLNLHDLGITTLAAGDFAGLTLLSLLLLDHNMLSELPAGVFAGLTSLTGLRLENNMLVELPAGVFAGLTSLTGLRLGNNMLADLPDDVFEPLTSLRDLRLSGNPEAPFAPEAVALPDDGTVSSGGTVTLDGSGSGGAWGTNVTCSWALTPPPSGVTVSFDDSTSVTPQVTIPALVADTDLTFTLTVTGRGGTDGIDPETDTATVMVNVTNDATLSDLALEDGDGNAIALSLPFAPDTAFYTASVAYYPIDPVTLTAVKNDSNARVVITNDDDTATLGEAELDLIVGSNTLTVTVTSEDGSTTKPYRVTVTRANAPGICGRTPAVRDALVARISVITDCAYVTDVHLATITGYLNLGDQNITALAVGDFAGLTALTGLDLDDNELTTLPDNVFAGLTSLTTLRLTDNSLDRLPAGAFDSLTTLKILRLNDNQLTELSAGVFDNLTALATLALDDNALGRLLPDDVFEPLTLLTDLRLSGNPGGPFRPAAVALPDGGTVSSGGTVTLDGSGSGSGGAWGTNVTYSWALPRPASGVTVSFDDDTSAMPAVTIPKLAVDTELTFTLTVTGRGGTNGIAPGTDTATVTVTASADATLESLTVNDGTSDRALAPPFVSDVHIYTAVVGKAVTTVTLTAMTTDSDATVTAVTLDGNAIADTDFTDGIEVPSLLAGENEIVVTVRAEDTSTTQTYTVTVTANTAPTAINSSVTTDEDTAHTFATTQFSFADDDGDALVSVTVVTPPAAGALALGGAAVTADQEVSAADIGQLVFTPASNAHGQDYASFTFKVSDFIDESDSAYTMTVHVTAVNDAATGAPGISGTAQVGEKLTAGQGDIDDIDGLPNAFPGDYSFQWVRVDADGISNPTDISGETGSTYTPADADVGKKLQVKVSFTDDDNSAEELTSEAYPASGTVEAAPNVAPAFSSSATFDVAENQTAVGTVQATDADDDVTGYAIEGGADLALFMIDLTSGELSFNTAPNYEAAASADGSNTYVVDVRATSGVDIREKTTDQTITVTVTDVDEPPGAPGAPTVESASVVSVTATWVSPSNAGPAIEDYDYRSRVKDPEGSWVEVTNTTSKALRATIDGLAENTEYDVQVRATNAEGMGQWSEAGSGSTDANTAPTAINSSVATDEDTPHTFAVGEFSFADGDGHALESVTVVTPPAAGALALGGVAVTADQAVSAADIGQLVFTPASNAHGQDYASFTFKVSDFIDESDSAYTMTVHVTAVNDAATGAPGITGTAQVGEKLTAGQGDIDDIDGLPNAFPGDYSFQWVRVDADGISNPTDISGETGSTYTPADADVGKKLQVKVSFTDDDNSAEELTSEAYPASGTVEAAPVFTTSATFDVAENQTAVGTVQATDADADDDVTGYTIEGGADEALFVIGPTSGELSFNTAPNYEAAASADGSNTYVVDVQATSGVDIREKTTDQTITVTVTDVDEPPGAPGAPTVSASSVVSVTATWVAPSNAGPAIEDYDYRSRVKDPEGSWVEVTNTTITAVRATIDGLAENTEYDVQVRATNAEGMGQWSEAGFGSTDANTAPTAINSSVATDEDTPHTFATTQFSFADGDGDALESVTVVTPPAAGALALGVAAVTADQEVSAADIGQLVFTPASNAHGQDYASFTFKVSDGIDESDSAYTMTVHVTAVNDAATGAPGISGTAQVGEQLTAGQGDIDDIDGLPTAFPGDYSFQWVRVDADGISNPTDISGETGSTYTPADADVGKKLQVKVSFTDDDNSAEELTSEAYPASGTVEAAPVFTTSATFDVAENQTAVGTVQATDADADDDVTGYTIEGGADLKRCS